MTRVITELCTNEGSCILVCPVDCIVPGPDASEWKWHYIDPDVCIDCGACQTECPTGAIFRDIDLPEDYLMKPGQKRQPPESPETIVSKGGEIVDLTGATEINERFFYQGPGYDALD